MSFRNQQPGAHEPAGAGASLAGRFADRWPWWTWPTAVTLSALVLFACSAGDDAQESSASSTTGSTAAPTVASTATSTVVDTTQQPAPETSAEATGVSFRDDIQPILETSCASCHQQGGPGAAHLLLGTAGDASDNALFIASAVDIGYMPPWPAGDGDLEFHDDRRLTEADRRDLMEWLDSGGVLDIDRDTPLTSEKSASVSIERDVVMVGAPYKGSSAKVDDYRCQIYDPGLTETGYLQSFGFEPDRTEVVHHALLFRARAATREQYEALDAADPAVGWPCTGLTGIGGGDDNVKQIMSWAPGQDATVLPADTAIVTDAGDYFITQIHYHYEPAHDDLAPDESTVVVDFASDQVIAAAGGALQPIELTLYLGPAEIPCSTEQTGPLCDREAARRDLSNRAGFLSGWIADGLLAQCGKRVEDFAGMTNGQASSTCDLPAHPGQIVSVWAHMHELGSTYRMILNPGTDEELVLLDIPKWDFDWQLNYSPVETVVLDTDDIIRVECNWDRKFEKKGVEPRYIMWAEGTYDEMCYSQIVTRPPTS